MLFPTLDFFAFFTLVLILNWSLKKWSLIWRLFLLLASYFFYSVWDLRFLLILILVSLFNFLSALSIYKDFFGKKKNFFIISLIYNLSLLGIFKYYDFFRVSAESLLERFGFSAHFPLLEIILPIGLSFYIFKVISYNIDVYLGKIMPTSSFLDFSIYVSFFPHLLSGPIMRAGDFLIQLKDGGAKKIENLAENFALILMGLFKKLVISSYLTISITDDVFAVPENHSPLIILLAIFAYTLVIYFDFSGYSDMAIGFAGLLGFKSPINFDSPYLVTNLRDFWRRWHITLSDWIRDYVYIPLGGGQKGKLRKYFNLMVAMILTGLWHGAAGHFIFWGFWQGLGLTLNHAFLDLKKSSQFLRNSWQKAISSFLAGFLTFNFISFGWIFFRSENLQTSFSLIKSLFNFHKIFEPFKIYILFLIIFGFFVFLLERKIIKFLINFQQKLPFFLLLLLFPILIILIFKFSPDILPSFIYFKF